MRTVSLEGGTVELRERGDVKVRHRQIIEAAAVVATAAINKIPRVEGKPDEIDFERIDEAGLSFDEMQTLMQLQNASILALLAGWSFPEPVPTSLGEVLEMPAARYQQLANAVRADGAGIVTETSFEPSSPQAPGFAETPTPGSTGSAGGSKDATSSPDRATVAS